MFRQRYVNNIYRLTPIDSINHNLERKQMNTYFFSETLILSMFISLNKLNIYYEFIKAKSLIKLKNLCRVVTITI